MTVPLNGDLASGKFSVVPVVTDGMTLKIIEISEEAVSAQFYSNITVLSPITGSSYGLDWLTIGSQLQSYCLFNSGYLSQLKRL